MSAKRNGAIKDSREYPDSSDEETPIVPMPMLTRIGSGVRGAANNPGPSGSQQSPTLPPSAPAVVQHRIPPKNHRDHLFWSMITNTANANRAASMTLRTRQQTRAALRETVDSLIEGPLEELSSRLSAAAAARGRQSHVAELLSTRRRREPVACVLRSRRDLLESSVSELACLSQDLISRIRAKRAQGARDQNDGSNSTRIGPRTITWGTSRQSPGRRGLVPDLATFRAAQNVVNAQAREVLYQDESEVQPPESPQAVESADDENVIETVSEPLNMSTAALSLEEEIVEIDDPDAPAATPPADNDNSVVEVLETTAQIAPQPANRLKRKRDGDSHESVSSLNRSILCLLECPVCMEWMDPPLCQCRRGHLVCGACRPRLAVCPVCRAGFSSVRNRAMEGVAEILRYPCRHGCGREVRLRKRGAHEASCAARRYSCPLPACAAAPPLPRPQLAHHCQTQHPAAWRSGRVQQFSVRVNNSAQQQWVVAALEQVFHVRVDVDVRTWGVLVYVAYVGPQCHARRYTYEVIVMGRYNARKLVYMRTTHSDLESSALNTSRQDCFHLSLDQAHNFLRFKNKHSETDKLLDITINLAENDIKRRNNNNNSANTDESREVSTPESASTNNG